MSKPVHQGLPVPGYIDQSAEAVQVVTLNKHFEERLMRRIDACANMPEAVDQRWLAIARSHFEQGFMAFNRAIFKPSRIRLPEDDDGA